MGIGDEIYLTWASGLPLLLGVAFLVAGVLTGKRYNDPKSEYVHPNAAYFGMLAAVCLFIGVGILSVQSQKYRNGDYDEYEPIRPEPPTYEFPETTDTTVDGPPSTGTVPTYEPDPTVCMIPPLPCI